MPSLNRAVSLEGYLEQEPGKSRMFRRQSARLEFWLGRRGRLLDLGCAAGLFARVAAERGWRVTGCDTWEEAVEYGRKRWQLDLRLAGAGDWGAVEGRFDAIVLWDSIEHLPRPGKILEEIRGRLRPDGVLALSTPDYGSFSRRLLGSRWQFFERAHLTFFSRKTLSQTLEGKGYRVCECASQPKIVSLAYLARDLAKWHPGLSSTLGPFLERASAGRHLVTVPGGMLLCYARRG